MAATKLPVVPPGLAAAEPLALAGAVEYGPQAIVSRTILKRPAGTLTLFAFDAGQGLSEHTAPFDAIVQVLDGRARLTIGGKAVEVRTGEAVLMPARVPHAVDAIEPFKMLLIMIQAST